MFNEHFLFVIDIFSKKDIELKIQLKKIETEINSLKKKIISIQFRYLTIIINNLSRLYENLNDKKIIQFFYQLFPD